MASHSFIDETGKRYGRLSVVGVTSPRTSPIRFVCLCDCGAEVNVIGSNLRRGNSQSCGCLNREPTKVSNTTHGHSANRTLSRTYAIWRGIVHRAGKRKDYLHTTVCDRWKDYTLFLQDMGEAPLGASIDRFPDQRGNYEPGNCRWATMREQQNNRTNNRLISFNGKRPRKMYIMWQMRACM